MASFPLPIEHHILSPPFPSKQRLSFLSISAFILFSFDPFISFNYFFLEDQEKHTNKNREIRFKKLPKKKKKIDIRHRPRESRPFNVRSGRWIDGRK